MTLLRFTESAATIFAELGEDVIFFFSLHRQEDHLQLGVQVGWLLHLLYLLRLFLVQERMQYTPGFVCQTYESSPSPRTSASHGCIYASPLEGRCCGSHASNFRIKSRNIVLRSPSNCVNRDSRLVGDGIGTDPFHFPSSSQYFAEVALLFKKSKGGGPNSATI